MIICDRIVADVDPVDIDNQVGEAGYYCFFLSTRNEDLESTSDLAEQDKMFRDDLLRILIEALIERINDNDMGSLFTVPQIRQCGSEVWSCMPLLLENDSSEHVCEVLNVRSSTSTRHLRNEYATEPRQIFMYRSLYSLGTGGKVQNTYPELGGGAEGDRIGALKRKQGEIRDRLDD